MLTVERTHNLLMIEDNPADVRLMLEAIREAELDSMICTRYAYDGEEALDILESSKALGMDFDMILLDLNMPKVSGKEILGNIKGDEQFSHIPVVVMTNSDYKHDMIDCYNLKANSYLQKPTDFKRLVDFFSCMKISLQQSNRRSIFQIERHYYEELAMAV